jgi:drug/metabolite transporter (DMT)-like permease
MPWFLLAVFGHLTNAAAFVIDKALLSTAFKRSATYAALIGALSAILVVGIPWMPAWPSVETWPAVILFGALFPLALWAFFEALREAEASRVVPIVGSLIPPFTLTGTVVLLGERVSSRQVLGILFLLLATGLLTRGGRGGRVAGRAILTAVVSAVMFAAASVAGKMAFTQAPFWTVFISSRLCAALTGFVIAFADVGASSELRQVFFGKAGSAHRKPGMLAVVGQVSGAIGFFCVNAALAEGSAAIVNALQAVQYAAIVLVAWFGGTRLRAILKEEKTARVMALKGAAIILVGIGLALVSVGGTP